MFEKMSRKKVEKKVIFIFANFFFKIHFGHFFMSNFKIKKKVLKSWWFSLFSTFFLPWKMLFIPRKSIFHVFFVEFSFWGEHFVIHHFFSFFRPWKYYHSSPENRYFMVFLRNSHFRRNFLKFNVFSSYNVLS